MILLINKYNTCSEYNTLAAEFRIRGHVLNLDKNNKTQIQICSGFDLFVSKLNFLSEQWMKFQNPISEHVQLLVI